MTKMTKYITVEVTTQQAWQLRELTRRETQRLKKIITDRAEQGKPRAATFDQSLAFNKRLETTLTEQVKS